MSLRFRLVLFVILLSIVSFAGTVIIVRNLNILDENQGMASFKDEVYHSHLKALTSIQAAQSLLYQHQAGYSRDIDRIVNKTMHFEDILTHIPTHYQQHLSPACNRCHDDPGGRIRELSDTISNIQLKLDEYRRHISVLMTTNDASAQMVGTGRPTSSARISSRRLATSTARPDSWSTTFSEAAGSSCPGRSTPSRPP